MNYIYEEKIYLPVIFLGFVIFIFGIVIFSWFSEVPREDVWIFYLITAIVLMGVLFSTINFAQLILRVTENLFIFRFGLFKKEIYIKNIEFLQKEQFSIFKYGGYGIRIGRGKIFGYVAGGGEGIQFLDKSNNRKYYVSTQKADELISLLVNYGAQKA